MTISVAETVTDGVERMASVVGAAIVALLFVMQFVNHVAFNSFMGALFEFGLAQTEYGMSDLQRELGERGYTELSMAIGSTYRDAVSSGIDVPLPVALLFVLVLPLIGEVVTAVAVRGLAVGDVDPVPTEKITNGLAIASLKSFVAGIIAWILIFIGLLFVVIPGIVLAILFLFVRQRVVLAGDGIFESLSESVSTVRANLLPVLALVVILFFIWVISTFVVGLIPVVAIQWLGNAVLIALAITLVTSAYLQAESSPSF